MSRHIDGKQSFLQSIKASSFIDGAFSVYISKCCWKILCFLEKSIIFAVTNC